MQKEIEITLKFKLSEEDSKSIFIEKTLKYFKESMIKDMNIGAKQHEVEIIEPILDIKET